MRGHWEEQRWPSYSFLEYICEDNLRLYHAAVWYWPSSCVRSCRILSGTRIFVALRTIWPFRPPDGPGPSARIYFGRCIAYRLRSSDSKKCYLQTGSPEGPFRCLDMTINHGIIIIAKDIRFSLILSMVPNSLQLLWVEPTTLDQSEIAADWFVIPLFLVRM